MTAPSGKTGAFSPAVIIAVVIFGVISFLGIGALSAYAPELRPQNNGGEHALSRSSTGYGGIVRLLRERGVPVTASRSVLGEQAADSLLVLTPSTGTTVDLDSFEHLGPVLVVLPKWRTTPSLTRTGWVRINEPTRPIESLAVLPREMIGGARLLQGDGEQRLRFSRPNGDTFGAPVEVQSPRALAGGNWIPVVVDQNGGVVLAMHEATHVYVLMDADLLNTGALRTLQGADTAVSIIDFIATPGSPVVFDLTLHGFARDRNLLRLLADPPFAGMTVGLLGLLLLAGWQSLARFGRPAPPERALAMGKHALADNTAGLVRMAKREHHMASPYAQLIRAAAVRLIGVPRHMPADEVDAFLDRIGATIGVSTPYSTLAARAAEARTPGDMITVAAQLYRWKQELTRGRH